MRCWRGKKNLQKKFPVAKDEQGRDERREAEEAEKRRVGRCPYPCSPACFTLFPFFLCFSASLLLCVHPFSRSARRKKAARWRVRVRAALAEEETRIGGNFVFRCSGRCG